MLVYVPKWFFPGFDGANSECNSSDCFCTHLYTLYLLLVCTIKMTIAACSSCNSISSLCHCKKKNKFLTASIFFCAYLPTTHKSMQCAISAPRRRKSKEFCHTLKSTFLENSLNVDIINIMWNFKTFALHFLSTFFRAMKYRTCRRIPNTRSRCRCSIRRVWDRRQPYW